MCNFARNRENVTKMKKSTVKIVTISTIIILLIIGVYVFITPSGNPKEPTKPRQQGPRAVIVKVTKPQKRTINDGIRSVGTLYPDKEVDIASETTGKIIKILFEEGSFVKEGQLLVKIDDSDLVAQLRRSEHTHKMLEDRLNRQRILLAKDAVSQESFDQVETDFRMLEADIELLKIKISRTEIRAPFDGIVGFRNVNLGSYIQPNTKIATITDNSILKVQFAIPEKYYSKELKGRQIMFSTAQSEQMYSGVVYAIDPKIDEKTRTATLRAIYKNTGNNLTSGMFVRVSMGISGDNDVMMIPTEAVIPQQDSKSVWVVRSGRAHSVTVETGFRSDDMVEITSGLTPSDSVITTGVMQLKEGSLLTIEK